MVALKFGGRMRRLTLVAALLLVGCLPTSTRLVPGSDVVLPVSSMPWLQSAGGVTCLTVPTPGVATTIATTTPATAPAGTAPGTTPGASAGTTNGMTTGAGAKCVGQAKRDSVADSTSKIRPPG